MWLVFRADDWLPDRGYQLGYHQSVRYAGPVRTQVRREQPRVETPPFGKTKFGFRRIFPRSFETGMSGQKPRQHWVCGRSSWKLGAGFRNHFRAIKPNFFRAVWILPPTVGSLAGCSTGSRLKPQKKHGNCPMLRLRGCPWFLKIATLGERRGRKDGFDQVS